MTKYTYFLLLLNLFILGCEGSHRDNKKNIGSKRDALKLQQYYISGEQLFEIHCNNCHKDGQGLAQLIPPLEDSDYFANDSSKLICAIKYGMEGSITVNGTEYNQPMPSNMRLTNLEIATLTTYVYLEFQNQEMLILPNAVNAVLENCGQEKEEE
jgi:cytochrome c551